MLFSGVCAEFDFQNQSEDLMVRSGIVVEIKSKVGEHKYKRERLVDGHCLFEMVEICKESDRKSVRFWVASSPDNKRNSNTLISTIKEHVKVGSIIHSDEWRIFYRLTGEAYEYHTVNHEIQQF